MLTHVDTPQIVQTGKPVAVALVIIALAIGGFAIGTTEFATMSLLPYFASALKITEATASHVISAYALGVVIGAPLLAILGARQSRKKLLIGLMLSFGLFNGLSALAANYPMMLLMRFLSGLPHGAYFGVASLVASSIVPPNKRAQSVAQVMMGLMIATIIGVPMANVLGQSFGWRSGFMLVAATAFLSALLIGFFAPMDTPHPDSHPLKEIKGLWNKHIWLTLSIGAIGFGGLFAVYTYVASTLIQVTGSGAGSVPLALGIIGLGMITGTIVTSRLADTMGNMTAAQLSLIVSAVSLFLYPFSAGNYWALCIVSFCIGTVGGLSTPLQMRLMDVAKNAQMVSAALNHSAFNVANARGAFLAGQAVMYGLGFPSTGFVGSALALAGLGLWFLASAAMRQDSPQPSQIINIESI